MKIVVLGTRGFPNVPGGVEKHCEELFPRIAITNKVVAIARSPYFQNGQKLPEWQKIELFYLWCPKKKSFEAIVHTILGIIKSRFLSPDLVHVHAIGPAIVVPFARLLGLKVVLTHHGPDYERQKWGKVAKLILKAGEYLGVKFSNKTIVISKGIQDSIKQKFSVDTVLIPNGVNKPQLIAPNGTLKKYGLEKGKYIFTACRLVPEKGLDDLISAYDQIDNKDYKLVIAGDADHETNYSKSLKKRAQTSGVILTGFQTGSTLGELFTNAGLFVLPSYYEGLPIALLEALSYSIPVLVSNIAPHIEMNLPNSRYYKTGNITDLSEKIEQLVGIHYNQQDKNNIDFILSNNYNWDIIAESTLNVYEEVVGVRKY